MGDYEICVKGMETYTITGAESEEDAIIQAIDCFCGDDEYYGSEEAENVTEDDCEVIWFEAYYEDEEDYENDSDSDEYDDEDEESDDFYENYSDDEYDEDDSDDENEYDQDF